MQRFQHPGIIRNYSFTSIVVGNSLLLIFRTTCSIAKNSEKKLRLNVEVHDMTGLSSVTHNSAHYSDLIHYNLEGARQVVDALASGAMKISSIAQHEQMLRNELRAGAELAHKSFETKCP
jgi:hypothetical protein